ncbi:sugar phosphate isomerase/epimerase (plasmid) [Sinorhizobium fredii NGR234]|uniref:Sugar phosphate isomerase/epimerase n=1 Tax=Sinorhizobium fredii (strain NBRC 101917 / NGR234) TaxID=394 RepID=C3KRP7_SINFN|nr:sugar phosphate isomerase/epimerase [Sinorhizobium fredii]ACP22755.1 sugar phosphate isomerase/epimerase [Sinorhizobium fredii NGR234]
MKIGLNTDGLGALSLEKCLDSVAKLGLSCVEFGLGGWSSAPHVDIAEMLASAKSRDRLMGMLRERNLEISALNCSGNQLHPGDIGPNDTKLACDTIELASLLGVSRIVMMSGLPAGGPDDRHPNWITSSWPLEAMHMLEWQWSERVIPFWRDYAKAAERKGVRLCVEQHGRQAVYNVESFFRLREAVGKTVGVNFDPSHLIWMGGDPISAINALGDCIYHVHGKDTRIELQSRVDGLLDPKHVTPVSGRSWNFVSLGHGTSVHGWLDIVRALKAVGYDDVISIENEDYSMAARDAIATSAATLRFCLAHA